MNCPNNRDEKLLDVYGEAGGDSVDYRDHVGRCSACRRDLAEMRAISLQFRVGKARPHLLHRWALPAAAAFLFAIFAGGIFPVQDRMNEQVGTVSSGVETPLSWEQDDTDWDEQIASLRTAIGSLEEDLGRMP